MVTVPNILVFTAVIQNLRFSVGLRCMYNCGARTPACRVHTLVNALFFDPMVGSVDIVRSDVLPDVVQIEVRIDAKDVPTHARGFQRSPDLRCKRARDLIDDLPAIERRQASAKLPVERALHGY